MEAEVWKMEQQRIKTVLEPRSFGKNNELDCVPSILISEKQLKNWDKYHNRLM